MAAEGAEKTRLRETGTLPFSADSLTLGQQCSYNEGYSTLKIEWYGVVVTLEDLA